MSQPEWPSLKETDRRLCFLCNIPWQSDFTFARVENVFDGPITRLVPICRRCHKIRIEMEDRGELPKGIKLPLQHNKILNKMHPWLGLPEKRDSDQSTLDEFFIRKKCKKN